MNQASKKPKRRFERWGHPFTTTVLIVLLAGQTAAFGIYQYVQIRSRLQPEKLVDTAADVMRERYPAVRATLIEEVQDQAPEIARQLSSELTQSTPEVRRWLEGVAARQVEYGLDEVTRISAEQFRAFVQDNREEVLAALKQAADAPEQAREQVRMLEGQFEKQFGADLQENARLALGLHRGLNDKLERLSAGGTLEPRELLELRIVRILKAIEQQALDDVPYIGSASTNGEKDPE